MSPATGVRITPIDDLHSNDDNGVATLASRATPPPNPDGTPSYSDGDRGIWKPVVSSIHTLSLYLPPVRFFSPAQGAKGHD